MNKYHIYLTSFSFERRSNALFIFLFINIIVIMFNKGTFVLTYYGKCLWLKASFYVSSAYCFQNIVQSFFYIELESVFVSIKNYIWKLD